MDKIVCLGKNYLEHARELGDAVPEKPVLFLKPPSVLHVAASGDVALEVPFFDGAGEMHHECEIVLRLGKGGFRISEKQAEECIDAVTLGLDMTLRDLQALLKKQGHPWTTSKVFPGAAIIGPWLHRENFPHYVEEPFSFSLDEEIRQQGVGTEMGLSPAQAVAYASEFFALCAGDLLFTGTPKGVGPVKKGQKGTLRWGPLSYSIKWI